MTHSANGRVRGTLASVFPPAEWLPRYQASWLQYDAVAGITLAAYAIPVSLAYASLAGVPPHYGIYCYLVGGIGYALFGTSRQLAVGPTSAIAMLVGTTVAGMAGGDPARWAAIASLTALVVAVFGGLAWLLRLSGLVNFISETILIGFKAGAALTIALTQLPKLFGVPGGGDHFFERTWILFGQLGETNLVVLTFGLVALALLVLGGRFFPGRPVALFVVAAAIIVMSLTALAERDVATVGAIPAGLPDFAWPSLRPRDVDGILPLAAACFLLAYVEGVSAARTLAEKHGYKINPRQELLALGAANLAAAFSHGFPVAGGLSQSAVNDKAGARTPLSLVFASAAIAGCLLFFTGLLRNLPSVVLAAIVLVAVRGLFNVAALRHLWRVSRLEFGIAIVALVGVLLLGILKGVLLAVIVSVLMLLTTAARPHVAFLGRIPGSSRYSDMERHPDNEPIEHTIIFRVEASLLYFNVDHVRNRVWAKISETDSLRLVVCDLSNSPYVDVAGAAMLSALHKDLATRGIQLRIVEAHARTRDLLRAEGLEENVGYLGRHMSIEQAIVEFTECAHSA
ncbi:MAG TPA: SulP family inorganic anion transporter [Lacipirellulaceae bacterium]|nr:SulP family inorganic anion transporter [Lacipirellulaceae bacterium]